MDAPGPPASPTSRMRLAAGRPTVGAPRDPLPEGVDLTPLFEAIEEVRRRFEPSTAGGGRAAMWRGLYKVFPELTARDTAFLAALDSLVETTMSLNHLLGSQSAWLAEHEERLRAVEESAREAGLRAPLPGGS
jgi:hypothetical protein